MRKTSLGLIRRINFTVTKLLPGNAPSASTSAAARPRICKLQKSKKRVNCESHQPPIVRLTMPAGLSSDRSVSGDAGPKRR